MGEERQIIPSQAPNKVKPELFALERCGVWQIWVTPCRCLRLSGRCDRELTRKEGPVVLGKFFYTHPALSNTHWIWTSQSYRSVFICLPPLKILNKMHSRRPFSLEAAVILHSGWNNLGPYQDISVSLGGGRGQVGSVMIRAILCSLKNRFGLPIVIFFFF